MKEAGAMEYINTMPQFAQHAKYFRDGTHQYMKNQQAARELVKEYKRERVHKKEVAQAKTKLKMAPITLKFQPSLERVPRSVGRSDPSRANSGAE
jgi:hypothetical protein